MSAERAADIHQPTTDGSAATQRPSASETLMRRPVSLAFAGGASIVVTITVLTAILLRLVRLDAYVLSRGEAAWAYDGWAFFRGHPVPGSGELPETSPFFLILEAISFFLFGVTDAIARFAPALLGIGIVLLVVALRPFVSRAALVGMVILAAISPTLVFASRTVDPAIAVAFSSLLLVVALMRAANADPRGARLGWLVLAGVGAAATLASGPAGVTALIALAVAFLAASTIEKRQDGAARAAIGMLLRSPVELVIFLASFAVTLVVVFSRLLSDFTALAGILTTFADWGRMMGSRSTPLPPSFFVYALLLYEILAVVFAIVAVLSPKETTRPGGHRLGTTFFGVWFLVSLVLMSFASGRVAEQTVLVALPLILLGGMGLGRVLGQVNWRGFWTTRAGLLPLAALGLLVGLIALGVAIARSNDPQAATPHALGPVYQIAFVVIVVIVPMVWLLWTYSDGDRGVRELGTSLLLVLAVLLGLFTFRSTTELAYYRADDGNELLARNLPTPGVRQMIAQIDRLSRDLSVENLTNVDNTGTKGLRIAVSPEVEWPFMWYFRDYPNARVAGPAGWNDSDDIVIALTPEAMDSAGFVVQQRAFENRTANAHADLKASTIFGDLVTPSRWYSSIRYLLFREMESAQPPSTVATGYAFRVSNKINPNLGPFDLFMRNSPGPGSGLGQLSGPTGITISRDGQVIYVVDAGNQRIERYTRDGKFLGIWDVTNDPGLALAYANGQGASGITVGDDGLVYVADTWNHIVLVLDKEGRVVRQLGQRGELTDIGDGSDPSTDPGLFFGPRGVAVLDNEIYVTDTGNERVQVFGKDGTFLRAFGGYGSAMGELIEPTGIVAGPDGNIWVADSGNGRVMVYTPRGEVVEMIPVPSWAGQEGVNRINDLAFGDRGILYLTSPAQGEIDAWDGNEIVRVGNIDAVRPLGIVASPDDMLLVTDNAESQVIQLAPQLPPGFGAPVASPAASPGATPGATPAG